jgi:hypothetical protein
LFYLSCKSGLQKEKTRIGHSKQQAQLILGKALPERKKIAQNRGLKQTERPLQQETDTLFSLIHAREPFLLNKVAACFRAPCGTFRNAKRPIATQTGHEED